MIIIVYLMFEFLRKWQTKSHSWCRRPTINQVAVDKARSSSLAL